MTVGELIEDIAKRKETLKITNQMLSDASGVPKTTVDRILRGDTPNPSMQTVLDIAYVVGYRFINDNDASTDAVDNQLVNMLVRESRLKTIQSNSLISAKNETIADKSHWVKFLTAATIIFALLLIVTWAGIALLFHYDLTHTSVGYFRG